MKVSEVGEFGLIEKIRSIVGEPGEGEVWVGDDAAVLRAPAGTILFTTDLMVEGVHFDLELTGAVDLGYKSVAVNVSDIAAMGGTPRRAIVGLGLRKGLEVAWVQELYEGMQQCAREFDMAIAGGDTSRSDCLLVSVALIGNPAGRRVIERKGARVGDAVCVTGVVGASAAGYRLLRAGSRERPDLTAAHLRPTPRTKEIEILRRHLPTAMIDISDGLVADLDHLCRASGVGAELEAEALPVADLSGVQLDRTPEELALYGGEDYELLFTIPPDRFDEAAKAVLGGTGTPLTRVGGVTSETTLLIRRAGITAPLEVKGWDHLRT